MYTEGYEGFTHLVSLSGTVEEAQAEYILRDHDLALLQQKKARMHKIAQYLNERYGEGTVELSIVDAYFNMKEQIEPHFHLIENAKRAMREIGVVPRVIPIRGGTDGARLSFMGLPCPNLCTGGLNFHSRLEFISVQAMEQVVALLLRIVQLYAQPRHADRAKADVQRQAQRAVAGAEQRAAQVHGEQGKVDGHHGQRDLNLGTDGGQRGKQRAEQPSAQAIGGHRYTPLCGSFAAYCRGEVFVCQ